MKRLFSIAQRQRYNIVLLIAVWIVYVMHVVPGGGVNPNRYFDLIHSIVHQHTLAIDAYQENTIDKAFKDGHYYSAGLPGPSILGLPSYLVFTGIYTLIPAGWKAPLAAIQSFQQGNNSGFYRQDNIAFFISTIWITWFTLSLFSSLSVIFLFRLFVKLGLAIRLSLISALAYAFGTPVFFFSTTYFSHVFNASTIILTLYVLFCRPVERLRTVAFLGLLAGTSILMEYQGLILISILGLYILYRYGFRTAIYYACGVVVPVALLLVYNYVTLGDVFAVPQAWLADETNRERVHSIGFLGFTPPHLDYILGLLVMPQYGLLVYSPILLLTPIGWFYALRNADVRIRDIAVISIAGTVLAVLWASSYSAWYGGATFGPRQIVSALPFFIIGTAFGLPAIPRLVWIPLFVLSVLTNWLGAQFGFASDVFQHWRTFASQGFALPWMLAILSHSRRSNPLLVFVTNYAWIIDIGYITLLAVSATLIRSVLLKWQLPANRLALVAIPDVNGSEMAEVFQISTSEPSDARSL